jgi:hypothetical protein
MCLLLLPQADGSGEEDYEFPIRNGYAASILGTPTEFMHELPEDIPAERLELVVFEDREVPEVFWYSDCLYYSLVAQEEAAPLIFSIAGTGAGYNSSKMELLQKAFYQAGFHVISISSPTHQNFIINASTHSVPGHIEEDTQDLYRVMELAWEQVSERIEATEFHLTGYSLGAAQSAFISKLDEEQGTFNFKKVYMINPPVNLYSSVTILDRMLVENIPGGLDHFDKFFEEVMNEFSRLYRDVGSFDFTEDYLYQVYKKRDRSSVLEEIERENRMEALIGFSFRISSSNMVFTSDVMSKSGLIVPKNRELSPYDSLTKYSIVCGRTSFVDYFRELFMPYFTAHQPGLTEKAAISRMGLESIEDYLEKAKKIAVVTNEDDFILAPGEVDYLRKVFGSRARIYPEGGHCGNMGYKDNIEHMIDFFKN